MNNTATCTFTLFTCPKPFRGHIGTIQKNAILSWATLKPRPDIVLIGDEYGTNETASVLGLRHLPMVRKNAKGTPLINSIFELGQQNASSNLVCYVNCDIILLQDFLDVLGQINFQKFLLIGQRTNLDVDLNIDFSIHGWDQHLRDEASYNGEQGGIAAIDYFAFPKGLLNSIPDFAVGRIGWDNWLLWKAKSMGVPIIDATRAILAVHQNHFHDHLQGGEIEFRNGIEAKNNIELVGGCTHFLNIEDADWEFSDGQVRRPIPNLVKRLHRVERLAVWQTTDTIFEKPFQLLFGPNSFLRKIARFIRRKSHHNRPDSKRPK